MKEEVIFYEQQRFSQSWAILIVVLADAVFTFSMVKSLGNSPMSDKVLIFAAVLIMLLTAVFFFVRFDTVVNNEGVYIKLFPFFLKYKCIPWDTVSKSYVRKYKPLWEYGGWGIRQRWQIRGRRSIAYSVSGNRGLQLELTNGRRILIGTRKPLELEEVLRKLNKNPA